MYFWAVVGSMMTPCIVSFPSWTETERNRGSVAVCRSRNLSGAICWNACRTGLWAFGKWSGTTAEAYFRHLGWVGISWYLSHANGLFSRARIVSKWIWYNDLPGWCGRPKSHQRGEQLIAKKVSRWFLVLSMNQWNKLSYFFLHIIWFWSDILKFHLWYFIVRPVLLSLFICRVLEGWPPSCEAIVRHCGDLRGAPQLSLKAVGICNGWWTWTNWTGEIMLHQLQFVVPTF